MNIRDLYPVLVTSAAVAAFPLTAAAIDYQNDILPIFESKCFKCHGDGKSKAGVSLDADKIAREIGDVITPGDPGDSDLYQALIADDRDDRMPPPGKAQAMSPSEIEKVKEWIVAGAPLGPDIAPTADAGDSVADLSSGPAPLHGDWTNKEGKTITATLLRVDGENAVLQISGGKIYNYPIANFDEESQAKVRAFSAPPPSRS